MNNETIGISAEIAIADCFNIKVDPFYRERGDVSVIDMLYPAVEHIFTNHRIPLPTKHIAEKQNPVDFMLKGNRTLSVKTNKRYPGKVAPQIIGQPTSETFFEIMSYEIGYNFQLELKKYGGVDTYENRSKIFKHFALTNIDVLLKIYWEHLFECDYLIYFYNILNPYGELTYNPQYKVLLPLEYPTFNREYISFTKTEKSWNESCTVKYKGKAIGEFQVHNNRNCFKFRFNFKNLFEFV